MFEFGCKRTGKNLYATLTSARVDGISGDLGWRKYTDAAPPFDDVASVGIYLVGVVFWRYAGISGTKSDNLMVQ